VQDGEFGQFGRGGDDEVGDRGSAVLAAVGEQAGSGRPGGPGRTGRSSRPRAARGSGALRLDLQRPGRPGRDVTGLAVTRQSARSRMLGSAIIKRTQPILVSFVRTFGKPTRFASIPINLVGYRPLASSGTGQGICAGRLPAVASCWPCIGRETRRTCSLRLIAWGPDPLGPPFGSQREFATQTSWSEAWISMTRCRYGSGSLENTKYRSDLRERHDCW
jgi:hypothetical protein